MASDNTRVTVAVFIRDQTSSLIDCLESLRLQTVPEFDLIIIDQIPDAARLEPARLWLEQHRSRFPHVELITEGRGLDDSSSQDMVFRIATTELIMLVDSENRLYPRCIESLLRSLDQASAAAAYGVGNDPAAPGQLLTWRQWNSVEPRSRTAFFKAMLIRKSEWVKAGNSLTRFMIGPRPEAATTATGAPIILVPEVLYERQPVLAKLSEMPSAAQAVDLDQSSLENKYIEQSLASALSATTTRKAVRDLLLPTIRAAGSTHAPAIGRRQSSRTKGPKAWFAEQSAVCVNSKSIATEPRPTLRTCDKPPSPPMPVHG